MSESDSNFSNAPSMPDISDADPDDFSALYPEPISDHKSKSSFGIGLAVVLFLILGIVSVAVVMGVMAYKKNNASFGEVVLSAEGEEIITAAQKDLSSYDSMPINGSSTDSPFREVDEITEASQSDSAIEVSINDDLKSVANHSSNWGQHKSDEELGKQYNEIKQSQMMSVEPISFSGSCLTSEDNVNLQQLQNRLNKLEVLVAIETPVTAKKNDAETKTVSHNNNGIDLTEFDKDLLNTIKPTEKKVTPMKAPKKVAKKKTSTKASTKTVAKAADAQPTKKIQPPFDLVNVEMFNKKAIAIIQLPEYRGPKKMQVGDVFQGWKFHSGSFDDQSASFKYHSGDVILMTVKGDI